MVGPADITPVTRHSRSAVTPPGPEVTGLTERAERITVTGVTAPATVYVPVRVPALVAALSLHVLLAGALAGVGVTLGLAGGWVWPGTSRVTLAGPAANTPVQGRAPVPCSTHLAPPA